jgi:hypothetical protein
MRTAILLGMLAGCHRAPAPPPAAAACDDPLALDPAVTRDFLAVEAVAESDAPEWITVAGQVARCRGRGCLEARARVYAADLPRVLAGAELRVRAGGRFGSCNIAAPGPVDARTGAAEVGCRIARGDPRLAASIPRIHLRGLPTRQLLVPAAALLEDGGATRVVVERSPSRFALRPVTAAPETGGMVRVIAGLAPGERVVTSGALFVEREIQRRRGGP